MKKKLKKIGSDGLMIYFSKEEQEVYGLVEGDVIEFDDMLLQNLKRRAKK